MFTCEILSVCRYHWEERWCDTLVMHLLLITPLRKPSVDSIQPLAVRHYIRYDRRVTNTPQEFSIRIPLIQYSAGTTMSIHLFWYFCFVFLFFYERQILFSWSDDVGWSNDVCHLNTRAVWYPITNSKYECLNSWKQTVSIPTCFHLISCGESKPSHCLRWKQIRQNKTCHMMHWSSLLREAVMW